MIKGLKRTLSELKKAPAGFGLLLKFDLQELEVWSSNYEPKTAGASWAKVEPWELNLGFHTCEDLSSIKDIEQLVWQGIASTGSEVMQTEERGEYIERAIEALKMLENA